jgi:glycosyltransferase involved in cell wall biosynthesis
MRVAIDGWCLRPPLTGIGHYVHRLMGAMLPLMGPEEQLLVYNKRLLPFDRAYYEHIESANLGESHVTGAETPSWNAIKSVLRQNTLLRKAIRSARAMHFNGMEKHFDLFHAVNYVPPAPLRYKPVLPIIYDLSHIRFTEMHPKERVEWIDRGLKLLLDVPAVQTISEFSKQEIVDVLGIPQERIHVIYPAPGEYFRPLTDDDQWFLSECRVESGKYFLFVGTREPRKNFKTVAEAYAGLPASMRNEVPLLWVGASGWGDLALSSAIERAKETGHIRVVGYIPDRALAALYRNTTLFLMPSIYEGFGMPVVEALACGASVALSKIPVFREIAGSNAKYIEAEDIQGWREVLVEAVEENFDEIGANRVELNLARFTWERSAQKTLSLYRHLTRQSNA